MSIELVQVENLVEDAEGRIYVAVVVGEERSGGRWIGRIRFTPSDGSPPLETGRETSQPNLADLTYWVRGLSTVYLEGALARARRRAAGAPGAGAAPAQEAE
jgi:hypothetical protein